ncbi:hypothetical protein BDA96_07G026500 [Sorghum bicolor]|uniref:Uncharacterized protein n=1 Tax=Sorghum bicolor TaxID=4558 RepID=A0A921QKR4_SORBI|nr:hypothetical protein BDA96_07G026500 [Sorghum bicolor]
MPPGDQGRSTPGNIADGDVPRRRRPIFVSRRCPEKISPENLKFERRVAEIQARQEEEQKQMTAAFMGSLSFTVCYPYSETLSDDHVQDGESIAWNVIDDIHVTSTPLLLKDSTQQGEGQLLKDSANKPPDDTDFLEGTFYKINLDKQKATITRNKKSSKKPKKKKGKGKGKGRKESYATEMQSEPPTQPCSTCAAATGGETLASSSSRVAVHVPQLGYSSSSSSSRVTAKLINTPAVNSPSSGNEKEPSVSSSTDDFKSFKSTTSYATAASSSVNDYAGSLSDARSERSLSASDSTDSRGFKKTSGEGNKPNVDQSFSLAVSRGCSQEALLCSDYASNDGDFQKVVSRKSAQKMKKMQRLESSAPSSTMAASSGPTIARELVPRAPFREVITIGHYINDVTFYGRKPNQRKGKYQKARSLSNLSKTGYTDGDVSGSNDTMLVITTVHQAKPRSSHHVTLEAIEETNSPRCRPKEGELKATAPPVGDGIKGTDSKAPSSDKSCSLGSLANSSCANNKGGQKKDVALDGGDSGDTIAPSSDKTSSKGHLDISSCVDRKQQKKAVALVDGGTEDIDSRAPTSHKTSSLGHLVNFSCVDREEQKKKATALVGGATQDINSRAPTSDKTSSLLGHLVSSSCADREEQKKKAMALVGGGGGTKDRDSRAPTSDKTSSLCHLVKSSCVDRKEQKKAMSPVGGDSKNTDSRAVPSDITLSLCHLAISSCADSEEQKKQENRIAFSTHASSQLDKIIKAANYVYEIQAASDVYMISGIHADIETFLHAATPVIGQISCTKSKISLQDQRLWSVWRWYEQPECYGIEVQKEGKINSIWPEFSTYFRPLLSAVQLFGQSGKSPNHGGLIFEYLEMENPFSRPPIFTKIKQLRDGVNLSGNPIFGDPKQLESVKLSDLHPASWFSVAWYPICQIPAAAGSCQASFLTYHSLGKLVPQTCSTDKAVGHDPIICPIVGLLGYKEEGEKWFQLRRQLRFKSRPNVSSKSKINHAELLNKRLRALKQGASIMSKAVMPRASGNYHSDYTFFQSRFH